MQASAARFCFSSASKKVIADVSYTVARSCYGPLRGKTHVASLSAQDPPNVQKRVTKQERRARVEEFVQNYRASHEGKFPCASSVRQQVGGSYYVARALLQELEYNSRLKSDARNDSLESDDFKETHGLNNTDLSTRDASTGFEGINEEVAKTSESLDFKTQLSECHGKTGPIKSDLSSSISLEHKCGPMAASDQTESNKMMKAETLESSKHAHGGSTETNLWGSLKSFAEGVRIFWKNL